MTQCSFGSQPKAGVPLYVWLTWNAFVAWAASKLGRLGSVSWIWWPDVPVSVDDFCATEITIPDAPTVADWLGMFTFDPVAHSVVENYLLALFKASVWSTVCECTAESGGGAPAECVSVFGRPFSLPNTTYNGSTVYDVGTKFHCIAACDVTHFAYGDIGATGSNAVAFKLWDLTSATLLWSQNHVVPSAGYHEVPAATISTLVAGHDYALTLRFLAGANVNAIDTGWAGMTSALISASSRIDNYPSGSGVPTREIAGGAGIAVQPIVCSGPIYVPPDPEDPTDIPDREDPTCTTTADLCAAINRLSAQLGTVDRMVNWLQSAAAPTGYALGTPIAVSGSGTLSVQDIVGLLVECSAPTMWRRTLDSPPRYIPKLGAIHFGDASGDLDEQQIHYLEQLVMGPPPLTTVVAYSFGTGVTATITPLQRLK